MSSNIEARVVALPTSVVEIVPGQLYGIGGGIPPGQSVSWYPDQSEGWMPMQCYCFISQGQVLVMDCGLPAHKDLVLEGLDALLEGLAAPRLLVSYWEPGAIGLLPWLVERYGVREVITYAGLNPFDFFESFEEVVAHSQLNARKGDAALVPLMPGDHFTHGDMDFESISPALRVLLTTWYYESSTRSLFTADAFPMLPNICGDRPYIARPAPARMDQQEMENWLRVKFDWLIGANCEAIVADLESIAARLPIDRICPSVGAIIEGAGAVQQAIASTCAALRAMAAEPRRSLFEHFDWDRALTADPLF